MSHIHQLAISVGLTVAWISATAQPAPEPVTEQPGAAEKLGYRSVPLVLEALKAKPGVTVNVTKPDGWIIVVEPDTKAMWSFTPEGHYAHPAVVRRTVKSDEKGNVGIEMVALCQATKEPCDRLIREFQQLNEQLAQAMRARSGSQSPK
jgi:hypothetical protein